MLKNMWYVAADACEVKEKPLGVKVLGQKLALFRDKKGDIVCLSDICVHRGASLSEGRVTDGCLECPYHGWQFDKDGVVQKIPAQKEGAHIPDRARVDSYPVEVLYGWVWVFMGDLPKEQRPPLPEFPEYHDPKWRSIRGQFLWQADYARVVENGLDFSHASFVHPSFGDRDRATIDDYKINQHAYGADAEVTYLPPKTKGLWKLLRYERTPVRANPGFHMSGALMSLRIHLTAKWSQVIFDVNTPIDENTTLTRWIHTRNFMTSKWLDWDARRRVERIFVEDAQVIEKVKPRLLPEDLSHEVSVKSDGLQMAFRRMRRNYIRKGALLAKERQGASCDDTAKAVASPARQKDGKPLAWVIPDVSYQDGSGLEG